MNLCGNKYYIGDLVDEIYEFYDLNTDDKVVEYAYLDCGNDGIDELAVRITVPIGDQTEYFIIKEIGGQLETIYSVDAWPRRKVMLGQYGFIALEASGGAAGTFFSKCYVDETGKLHYLFT